MINLVPTETRAKLTRFYRERLAIVLLSGSLFCLVLGSVFLIAPYRLAREKTISIERNITISKTLSSARLENNPEFEAKELSRRVELLMGKNSMVAPVKVLDGILENKPAGTKLEGFSYQNKSGAWSVEVRGVAGNRKALIDFVKALESSSLFSKVNVPVSNFVQEKDLPFTITLVVNKK